MAAHDEMTKDQWMAALEQLGLPIVGAERLGISRRTAQRIAAGTTEVPGPLAVLMRLMIKRKIKVEEVEKLK